MRALVGGVALDDAQQFGIFGRLEKNTSGKSPAWRVTLIISFVYLVGPEGFEPPTKGL